MSAGRITKIGKYEILDAIGRGGMGVVYKAIDPAIGRSVAIKVITGGLSDDPDLLKRFYREAQSTGTLQHPNIVTVYDLGDDSGTPYLVMEYVEGETLEAVIRSRRDLLLAEKVALMVLVCDGLDYAHRHNVIHRDIKPANLIIPNCGGLKIVDFGIARFGNDHLTRTGRVMGSIHYMSPEQVMGAELDARTDMYSTAVVLFELLTGELPFRGKDTSSTLKKILDDPPPPLSTYLRDYPTELDEILARALAKSRQDRYPSMEEFAFHLQRLQEDLRRELIGGYLLSAESCIKKSEWGKAKENLRQILRLDRQNTHANELARLVQGQIQKQLVIDQVQQLRERAEDAVRLRQWDDAVACLQHAIELDPSPELVQLRDSVRQRRSDLSRAIARAEVAHRAGQLEAADKAIAEALTFDADDSQANALKAIVSKELADRVKRKQIEDLLEGARREISSQRFTAALELLKQAEELDPRSADVQQLATFATTAQQQQRRKQLLEKTAAEINNALSRDDFGSALSKANEALFEFPADPGLLQLRAFAEKQGSIWSQRIYIESQIAVAREMLKAGQTLSAADVLKGALIRYPDDANLISLLNIVDEALLQEKSRTWALRQKQEEQKIVQPPHLPRGVEPQAMEETALWSAQAAPQVSNPELDGYATALCEGGILDKSQRGQPEASPTRPPGAMQESMEAARQRADEKQYQQSLAVNAEAQRNNPGNSDLASYRGKFESPIDEQNKPLKTPAGKRQKAEATAAVRRPQGDRIRSAADSAIAVLLTTLDRAQHAFARKPAVLWSAVSVAVVLLGFIIWIARPRPHHQSTVVVASVAVQISTSPPGATILINGQPRGVSNRTLQLEPGDYELEAELVGYETAKRSFSTRSNSPVPIDLVLNALSVPIRIAATDLEGGKVYVDDELVGTIESGSLIANLLPGDHILRIAGTHKDEEASAQLRDVPGITPSLVSTPQSKQLQLVVVSSRTQTALVRSTLSNSTVNMDGKAIGQLGEDGLLISNLEAGTHELKFGDGKTQRKMSFQSAAASAVDVIVFSDRDVGSILIEVKEDNATVFVDGKAYRVKTKNGRLRIPSLKSGQHTIRVSKDGFGDGGDQTVTVVRGEESRVPILLQPFPRLATLELQHMPVGSKIQLDREPIGEIGADGTLMKEINPGSHQVTISVAGYESEPVTRTFTAGTALVLSTDDFGLKHLEGTLKILAAASEVFRIQHDDRDFKLVKGGESTKLVEGTYTVVPQKGSSKSITVAAGQSFTLSFQTSASGMEEFAPKGWVFKNEWYSHRGGLALYDSSSETGHYVFTLRLDFGHLPFSRYRISWVLGYLDEKNYTEMQMDNKFAYRTDVVDGTQHDWPKQAHHIPEGTKTVTIAIDLSATTVTQRYEVPGSDMWVTLWANGDRPSLDSGKAPNFIDGKFGFKAAGDHAIEIANFRYTQH